MNQQQPAPQARPRSKSTFSFRSDRSGSDKAAKLPKEDFTETAQEKSKAHFSVKSKNNPNAAMNEAQPVAAALAPSTLASLRETAHTDVNGNVIAEPDLSNPTRQRWERPLDTIRSFEDDIDRGYKRRTTRPGTADANKHNPQLANTPWTESVINPAFASQRSSSYYSGGYDQANVRHSQVGPGGYFGGRQRDSYADGYGNNMPISPPSRNRFNQRQHSDPSVLNKSSQTQQVYPSPGFQSSRDTVDTGISSGRSEPWAINTDPTSSENSSIDRANAAMRQDANMMNDHAYNSSFQNPIDEEGGYHHGFGVGGPNPRSMHLQQPGNNGPPVPAHDRPAQPRNHLIKLGAGGPQPTNKSNAIVTTRPDIQRVPSEQRKSWFKRTFSKRGRD
ncbi:hypothetical protein K402DRAFT_237713 [Aulographum hederae CBS 113979]|uniref:Uncharacterized protein n=1 Tax=Aulographum hederae CBS 113979 TaxID=1176131 RepID=A0A6G1GKK1_9PEZI|nr:hypothetical protein K402DRAFT_237713 [Aulographum hederae CBS 113979]